jgi:hypothetical protein
VILHFVVSGNECVVHAHPQDTLRTCVDIAFMCTRYNRAYGYGSPHDGEDRGWEVRDDEGRLLNEDMTVADLGQNQWIHITLPAGSNG